MKASVMNHTAAHLIPVIARALTFTLIACMTLAFSRSAIAQQADPSPGPSDQEKRQDQEKDKSSSLDDLLGIDEDEKDQSGADAASKDAGDELQRRLNEAEIADNFSLAVEKMAISAELLDVRFDSGLGTQRVQEEIIQRLETLLDQAKKNQSRSRGSSSSSSSSAQQQNRNQQQNPGQQPTQNQQQQRDEGNQRRDNPSDSREGDPPPLQEGDINTALEESRTEWGNLPPRVRDQLMQGRREKFSSLHERLTQEYYKRLAEEGTP
jgi:hypothetical protein